MDAATFNEHFEELVVGPACSVGFEPWGKALWMERDGLRVAVLRTTPEVVLHELERHGEGAWAEARWMEDYREFIRRGRE